MSSRSTKKSSALTTALLVAAAGIGACTEVQIQETRVLLDTGTNCGSNNNGTGGFNSGGNQQPQMSSAVMDTYIVQVFELYDPANATTNTCDDCLARRQDPAAAQLCFLEHETCVCGDQTSVSPAALPGELQNLRVGLPANYKSLYCLRIMAVQRTSQAEEQCQCDSSWETTERTRLCAVSKPYSAGPAPVSMTVQCSGNQKFAACAVEPTSSATASMN
jgi:hypothetical protein